MALPSWIYEQQRRVQVLKEKAIAPVHRPMADSPLNAPGWKELGITYTCIPDSVYPWDPKILKRIQEFDPDVRPLWVRHSFLSPDNTEIAVIGRHGIGRYKPTTIKDVVTLEVEGAPPGMEKPNIIEFVWSGPSDGSLPGDYKPFDDSLVAHCRTRYTLKSAREAKADMHNDIALARARRAKAQEEHDYIKRDLDKYVQKKLDNMSEVELKETFGNLHHRKHEPKLYVHR